LSQGQRRLAAIMFTDMVGYTALGQRNESLSLALVEEQRKVIRPVLVRHNGREVKTMGDAFLVEFPNAVDAVRCAYDIQRAVREFNLSLESDKRVHLRIGVHVGEVVESQGDIFGDAVNVASRIEPLAEDGGVCVTSHVYDFVRGKVDLPLTSVGPKALKNLNAPMEVYKMVMPWELSTHHTEPVHLPPKRIAVLPFVNISPDPNDEYFADGLTEEMISRLSRLRGLDVIARTSVMNYKSKEKNVAQIGKELGAGSLLEGSVRKAGERIRVTVQLIDSNTEGHLWAENYDRDLGDIFGVQSDVAEQVAGHLELQLLPQVKSDIERKPTENVEAYSLYLRGLQYTHEDKADQKKKAFRYFEQSIQLDPNFSLAYLEAAREYFTFGNMGYMPPKEAYEKGEAMLAKAQQLEPNSPDVLVTIATKKVGNYEWSDAEALLRKAIESSPSNAAAHSNRAFVLNVMGRFDESQSESVKSTNLDPLHPNWGRCAALYYQRRYDDAIAEALGFLNREPESFNARTFLAYAYLAKSMFEEAISEIKKNVELAAGDPTNWSMADLALIYTKSGRKEQATKILEQLQALAQERYVPPDVIAVIQWGLGNGDKALVLFEKAYEDRSISWIQWLGVDPLFDDLRTDERFTLFLRKVGFHA